MKLAAAFVGLACACAPSETRPTRPPTVEELIDSFCDAQAKVAEHPADAERFKLQSNAAEAELMARAKDPEARSEIVDAISKREAALTDLRVLTDRKAKRLSASGRALTPQEQEFVESAPEKSRILDAQIEALTRLRFRVQRA